MITTIRILTPTPMDEKKILFNLILYTIQKDYDASENIIDFCCHSAYHFHKYF